MATAKTAVTVYHGFTIWPVLNDNDTTRVDYFDIHARGDEHGEGEPINMFGTRAECAAWIRAEARSIALDELMNPDRLAQRFTNKTNNN